MKTTDTDRLMLREFAVESHAGDPEYVSKRRERVLNLLDDVEELKSEVSKLRMELVEIYALKRRMADSFGKLGHSYERKCNENRRMKVALEACGIDRDNPDTCTVCGMHFHDCEDDRLADEVNGEFIDIGPSCPGAWARSALGVKQIKKDTVLTWELCRHDILRRKCIECSKE